MDFEPIFKEKDLQLIESLSYDSSLKPCFDVMRNCLVWADERPEGLSPAGYESLIDLWIARSFLHEGKDFSSHSLDPQYFEDVWKRAKAQNFNWPGFMRLALDDRDREYLERERAAASKQQFI